jgi:small subunit ribosomal protein S3
MGQKVNPKGLRLGIIEGWDSFWYANDQDYGKYLAEDIKLRKYLKANLYKAGISKILIGRKANQIEINLYTAKPGLIIGKGGKEVAAIREKLIKMAGKQIQLNIHEEHDPEACAVLVAEQIAASLERRISFRRALKQAASKVLRFGGKGVKVMCAGRLGGAEIARTEWYRTGKVPLQTLRAKIDYGFAEAMTLYGKIGVKVWIYKGDVLKQKGSADVSIADISKSAGQADLNVEQEAGSKEKEKK